MTRPTRCNRWPLPRKRRRKCRESSPEPQTWARLADPRHFSQAWAALPQEVGGTFSEEEYLRVARWIQAQAGHLYRVTPRWEEQDPPTT